MPSLKQTRLIFLLLFLLSAAMRVALALVNREANDDHMEVVELTLTRGAWAERDDCWECFQPKLYYALVIAVLRAADLYPGYHTDVLTVAAQLLNAAFGIALVGTAWLFLERFPSQNNLLKIFAFALTAFNPKMIGSNAQATNDTLAILLAAPAIYFALAFFEEEKPMYLAACALFAGLGFSAKSNALVTAGAIFLSLLFRAYSLRKREASAAALMFAVAVILLAALNPLGQYAENYRKYGSIVVMNRGIQRHNFPSFFEKTYVERPGIVSIADGFFTFKYFDLLRTPRLTNGLTDYPAHRTSFWTQIFAYAHSVHFDDWPPSWSSTGEEFFALTRAIFVFALLPSGMILFGAARNLARLFSAFWNKRAPRDWGLLAVSFWAHVAFLMLYAAMYRDFSLMKTIFIYPALLSFSAFFIETGELLAARKGCTFFLTAAVFALVLLYCADVLSLTVHLGSLLAA